MTKSRLIILLLLSAVFFSFGSLTADPSIIKVPLVRQGTNHTCGVASLQSVLAYYGDSVREDDLAKELKSTSEGTSWREMEKYARKKGFNVIVYSKMAVGTLKQNLDEGRPVMLAIQAWRDSRVDYKDDWNDGHWVVAIGYDEDNFYFMDPSTLGNYTFIPQEGFLERWHDLDMDGSTELVHFALVISKGRPSYDADAILPLD